MCLIDRNRPEDGEGGVGDFFNRHDNVYSFLRREGEVEIFVMDVMFLLMNKVYSS